MSDLTRLTLEVVEALRRENHIAGQNGWKASIGVDDVDLLLDAADALAAARVEVERVTCTVCDELLMPFEESVPDQSVETDDRWAHRECMEAGE